MKDSIFLFKEVENSRMFCAQNVPCIGEAEFEKVLQEINT